MVSTDEFGETAKVLSKNPLGIIALFIILAHGSASLIVGMSPNLEALDKHLLTGFVVGFPAAVLLAFTYLVCRHHTKLYSPLDFPVQTDFTDLAKATSQAAASLGAATASKAAQTATPEQAAVVTQEAVENIARVVSSVPAGTRRDKTVLWVDDQPGNNVHERQALEAFGVHFVLSTSTEDAINKATQGSYDAIISDMKRGEDGNAGYTLLERLQEKGDKTPFILYSPTETPESTAEALDKGAKCATNRPDELFKTVARLIGMKPQKV